MERVVQVCQREQTDLLLIAGDLFHRQPLLRELKELDYLFSGLDHTRVVFVAGNHDYLKPASYYRTYRWQARVFPLLGEKLEHVEFPELRTCVYGLSYGKREITERLYDEAWAQKRQPVEILLAHGGDAKHIPFDRNRLAELGYTYVALGHIHRPEEVVKNRIYYAGSLEPTDVNDTGKHGFIRGLVKDGRVQAEFVPFASREYIHMDVMTEPGMTGRAVREKVLRQIEERGTENLYRITLKGFRDADMEPDTSGMDKYGNIIGLLDCTRQAYDFEKLWKQNRDSLLGRYIEALRDYPEGSIEYQALYDGVRAILETKRG
ncbi:MAG TPA: DNA repair exonuclease [Candidatus Bariatricus faecipullorum]|nr:DNA repair exonuclease [Candidatus Bariatricus faecipullorum]